MIISFFLLCCFTLKQTNHEFIDSLKRVARKATGTIKIDCLNQLSERYISSTPAKAKVYAEEALTLAKKENYISGRIEALQNLGEYYLVEGASRKSLEVFSEALSLSQKKRDKKNIGISNGKVGVAYYFLAEYDKALEYQLTAIKFYKNSNQKKELGTALSTIGHIYIHKDSYNKALDYYYRALKVREELKDPTEIAKSFNSIGEFYFLQNDYQKAYENYIESYKRSIASKNNKGIAISLTNIGTVLAKNGKHEAALDTLFKALDLKKKMGNKKELARSYQSLGMAFYENKNHDKALDYYFQALSIVNELDISSSKSLLLNEIAVAYADKKEFNLSLVYHDRALKAALERKSQSQILACYEALANTYLKKNDSESFVKHYKTFINLKDSLKNAEKIVEIAQIQEEYELERKNKELQIIKKEKELQEVKLAKQQNFIYLLLFCSFLGMILLVLTYSFYKLKKISNDKLKKQNLIILNQNKELNIINKELKELNQKLLISEDELTKSNQTKDKFFSIISHDLRGPLNSFSSFLSLLLNQATSNTFDQAQILDIIRHTEKSLKNLSTLLNNLLQWSQSQMGFLKYLPENLSLEEVVINITKLLNNEAANKNITVFSIIEPEYYVKSDKNMLDFVLRNLISNAIKFTPTNGHIKISGVRKDNFIEVSVKDNGIGIDKNNIEKLFNINTKFTTLGTAKEKGTGLGLILCKEFIEKNGGQIWAENNPDSGAVFKFTLPFEFKTQMAKL